MAQLVKNPAANAQDAKAAGSIPGLGRSPGEGNAPVPVFLPGKVHGQRSLVTTVPGIPESDKTEHAHNSILGSRRTLIYTHTQTHLGLFVILFTAFSLYFFSVP